MRRCIVLFRVTSTAHFLRSAALLLVACAREPDRSPTDASTPIDAGCARCPQDAPDADAATCTPDARGFVAPGYVQTARVVGACTADEARAFAEACAEDPNGHTCGTWLGAHPTCTRCLLGDASPGPFRKSTRGF